MKNIIIIVALLVILMLTHGLSIPVFAQKRDNKRLVFSIEKKINKGGLIRVFKLYELSHVSNFEYELNMHNEKGKLLQTEKIKNNAPIISSADVQFSDVDNDGNMDLKVIGGFSCADWGTHHNIPWYKTWLYSQETGRYTLKES